MIPDHLIDKAVQAAGENWVLNFEWEHNKLHAQVHAALEAVAADIWDEAYRRGVDDARIADDLRVDVGLGPDLYAQPARQNPYRASETA